MLVVFPFVQGCCLGRSFPTGVHVKYCPGTCTVEIYCTHVLDNGCQMRLAASNFFVNF